MIENRHCDCKASEPHNIDPYAFLKEIRLHTWGMITGMVNAWYHNDGEYYQIEIDCIILDGWGEKVPVRLHMTAEKGESSLVERYRLEYQTGTMHRIVCSVFNFEADTILYGPETTPIMENEEGKMLEWFTR